MHLSVLISAVLSCSSTLQFKAVTRVLDRREKRPIPQGSQWPWFCAVCGGSWFPLIGGRLCGPSVQSISWFPGEQLLTRVKSSGHVSGAARGPHP